MADVQILAPGVEAAPLDYVVPQTSEILLRAAGATFDGTGAAGAFLPAIVITPPSGVPLPPFITDTAVAAGSSAEVAFAPFLRNAPTSTPSAGAGLPNAVMIKTNSQTVLGNHVSQITLDSSTFATTDASVFSASGSNIVIAADGLYASYCYFVPDTTDPDPAQTELFAEWITAGGGANAPWEQIVPRNFNVNGPAGLPGFQPTGAGLLHSIGNLAFAYCSAQPTSVKIFLATLDASNVDLSTCLHIVVQLQAISAADLAGFPSFPL